MSASQCALAWDAGEELSRSGLLNHIDAGLQAVGLFAQSIEIFLQAKKVTGQYLALFRSEDEGAMGRARDASPRVRSGSQVLSCAD
jgi:hypothetical protein